MQVGAVLIAGNVCPGGKHFNALKWTVCKFMNLWWKHFLSDFIIDAYKMFAPGANILRHIKILTRDKPRLNHLNRSGFETIATSCFLLTEKQIFPGIRVMRKLVKGRNLNVRRDLHYKRRNRKRIELIRRIQRKLGFACRFGNFPLQFYIFYATIRKNE